MRHLYRYAAIALALGLTCLTTPACARWRSGAVEPAAVGPRPAAVPNTILLRGEVLAGVRDRVRAGDAGLRPAYAALLRAADSSLRTGPWSVTQKTTMPPSGDRHDYLSLAPYWWPDSTKPNGLPYVRRDGLMNPASRTDHDGVRFGAMVDAVQTLSLAYYFTDDPRYADRAAYLLRVWFLDPTTRMNPNLDFAQAVLGVNAGRGTGIIDTRAIVQLMDALRLLDASPAWTGADREGLLTWCRAYLAWLRTSRNGREEAAADNNHGSWFDAQVAALALFVGDSAAARQALDTSARRRIDAQIAPDGRQPLELARTRPIHYSFFNLEPLTQLAEMARHVGVDLWHYRSPTGGSIPGALRFVAPYMDPRVRWAGEEVTPFDPQEFLITIRRAASALHDPALTRPLAALPADRVRAHRSALLYPDAPSTEQGTAASPLDTLVERALRFAAVKLRNSADSLDPARGWPRYTGPDGRWVQQGATQWTSGFFPGLLWQMYDLTREPYWRAQAERWTAGLERNATRTNTHDLGFLIFDSFGQGFLATGDPHYRDVVLTASRSLATRYNPTVGAIKSWDLEGARDRRRTWEFPVIIDNLMNLEMLFWAGANGGDAEWRRIAERHALTSARAHVRADGSTAHVALFDPRSGALRELATWQGASDTSAWARGQAWAIRGFTAAYDATRRPELLDAASRTADFWVAHVPPDGVPYWDFRDPTIPNTERDASAAAIAASGLLALMRDVGPADSARYRSAAERALASLATSYSTEGTGSAAILQHAVGGKPQGTEIDVGLVYADYYFVEALRRWRAVRSVERGPARAR